ncbi:HTH domain-containing protein, partial [Streptococcus suis]
MNDQERLLTIFLRLQSGAHLKKPQLADEFGVSEKTIQRDFALLGGFIESQPMIAAELAYDSKHHTRFLKGKSL